jgi:signal transduction histidine kinase
LVEDLLELSRLVTGRLQMNVQPVDLTTVVNDAIATVAGVAREKGVRVTGPANGTPMMVAGDAARLHQVAGNLLSNAVKFTPRGGDVAVTVERGAAGVQLTVADTGQGIGADFLPHVFERFRQEDGTTTRAHTGLGIGLAIVRELTELHGGSVSVVSAGTNQGSRFTVTLPPADASRAGDSVACAADRG